VLEKVELLDEPDVYTPYVPVLHPLDAAPRLPNEKAVIRALKSLILVSFPLK
jgi:hypothetical protein